MSSSTSGKDLSSEVTPYDVYQNRRHFIKGAATVASVASSYGVYRYFNPVQKPELNTAKIEETVPATLPNIDRQKLGYTTDEAWTAESDIVSYNNFYEFTTSKTGVASAARNFQTDGWELVVDGLVENPMKLSMSDVRKIAPIEERIYRMRCVEAWSMVIPWNGIPLASLVEKAKPKSSAKFLAFETLLDPKRMPGQKTNVLKWPYVEGLRLDEAMHPLAILAVGLYGKELPPQDGAPIRLVVPWKYGFKGIKSIVRISFVADQPPTSWSEFAPNEYGFFANVNPLVDHPRWSQATEQRIGERGRRPTLMFNGYEEQVASLYAGLDLRDHF